MSTETTPAAHPAVPAEAEADPEVVVVGAGIIGLITALSLAKRGISVTLIDDVVHQKPSYKVGESFLVSTGMARVVGELDDFLNDESFVKLGVWFTYGMEKQKEFRPRSEWVVAPMSEFTTTETSDDFRDHYLYHEVEDQLAYRALAVDQQICRPDAEERLRKTVRLHPRVRFLDTARVSDIRIDEGDEAHVVTWADHHAKEVGRVRTSWVVDCAGRSRILAKKLGHQAEERQFRDSFRTTAVWGQFGEITDDLFEPVWRYDDPDGDSTRRDLYTLHLWGEGYWIWVIRLSQNRVSVGVTFDHDHVPDGATPREKFFSVLADYPIFDGVLSKENLLEFRTYRSVQYVTDTFVHRKRYAMIGDSSSIIDAYYSQGMGQSCQTSWHVSNIIQKHLDTGELDGDYVDRVNQATFQDWLIIRNMVREKYTGAVADPRFFLLSHMLDLIVIWSTGTARMRWSSWLSRTGGDPSLEDAADRRNREYCETGLFYSRAHTWHGLPEARVRRLFEHFQTRLGERARWRLEHGEETPDVFCQLSLTRSLPRIWNLLGAGPGDRVDVSAPDFVAPRGLRRPGARSPVTLLPLTTRQKFHLVLRTRTEILTGVFLAGYALDALDTTRRKVRNALKRGLGRR
ncbi:FAD-dependent oxidoreductase [Streptomyces sp. NPDC055607]